MKKAGPGSRTRILDAARDAFAAGGFAGAGVDRIARQARVNKALIYYYFDDKQTLYRTVLGEMFGALGDRMRAVADADDAPADKLDRFIADIAAFVGDHPYLPRIMLRELAEGGAQLDAPTLKRMRNLTQAAGDIIEQGRSAGAFRPVDPLHMYFTLMGPIVMFLGGTPVRETLVRRRLLPATGLDHESFIRHLQSFVRGGLAVTPGEPAGRTRSRRAAGGSPHADPRP